MNRELEKKGNTKQVRSGKEVKVLEKGNRKKIRKGEDIKELEKGEQEEDNNLNINTTARKKEI